MKRKLHRGLLGVMLLLLMPGTLLACVLLIGAIDSTITDGLESLPAALILIIPPCMLWWGFHLLIGLRNGVHATIRRKLLAFYLVALAYCGMWLSSPMTRDGVSSAIFNGTDQAIGYTILILPVLITLFTKPGEKQEWNPLDGGSHPHDRRSDRLVAWLASRIR